MPCYRMDVCTVLDGCIPHCLWSDDSITLETAFALAYAMKETEHYDREL